MANRHNNKLFAGAGVIVCAPDEDPQVESATLIQTKHAPEVSRLLYAIREVFSSSIDHFDKYAFFGRLADAANRQIAQDDELELLREAIMIEACAIASGMEKHLYFAYGSNMDPSQMAHRCPDAIFVETVAIHHYELKLDCTGAATIARKRGSEVPGALWLISNEDEQTLDSYEGVQGGCYRKEHHPVFDNSGRAFRVLAYISNRDFHDGESYRSGYLDNIIKNAKRLGFAPEYIEYLESL